jgi:hypothetical protein
VSEETGLLVEIDGLTGVYKNMTHGIIALVFRCHVINGTPHPTPEASESAWLTPDDVRERMNPPSRSGFLTPSTTTRTAPQSAHTTAKICSQTSRHDLDQRPPTRRLGEPSPTWRQAGLLGGVAGWSCVKTPTDLRVELVRKSPSGAARKLRMTTCLRRSGSELRTNDGQAIGRPVTQVGRPASDLH